jgi:hypothetical protein
MTGAMVGPFIFLAAAALPQPAVTPAQRSAIRPTASAHATARIRIISGVKFGPDYSTVPPSALRRSASLTDQDGQVRSAELLEFQ